MRRVFFAWSLLLAMHALAQTATPDWVADLGNGCKVWSSYPEPNATISWSGDCKNGLAQGVGVLQWFKDGKAHSRYEGEYRDGKLNGRGVYTWVSGGRYEGELKDNKPNGRGVFTFADGDRYEGSWTNGCFRQRDRKMWYGSLRTECGF